MKEERLIGRWIHAHEEDAGGRMVYRRPGASLAPSRGRGGFELLPRGVAIESRIGPTDRIEEHGGVWRVDGDVIEMSTLSQPAQRMRVVSLEPGRLVLEPLRE